jgi:hypothetical protein
VSRIIRTVVGVNLQNISDLLRSEECWAYSIAFDGAKIQGRSLIDVRVRFFGNENIENIHLIAIPLHGPHTGEAFSNVVSDLLRVLCGSAWKRKLVGVCTDGARNMTGKISGAVTQLALGTLPGFFRVWCAAHKLDLVIQKVKSKILSENF